MTENKDYQKKLSEILPTAYNEEFKKLQEECKQFVENCNNFANNVTKNCEEKLKKFKEEVIEDAQKDLLARIDQNTLFWWCLFQNYKA